MCLLNNALYKKLIRIIGLYCVSNRYYFAKPLKKYYKTFFLLLYIREDLFKKFNI